MIINEYRNRLYKLLESELGNVKPLLCENENFTKVDVLGDKFFHATMGYEINHVKDLNPLFRQTDEYIEKQKNYLSTLVKHFNFIQILKVSSLYILLLHCFILFFFGISSLGLTIKFSIVITDILSSTK